MCRAFANKARQYSTLMRGDADEVSGRPLGKRPNHISGVVIATYHLRLQLVIGNRQ
jgi:hypothetical protein